MESEPTIITGVRPVGFGPDAPTGVVDILIGSDGCVAETGSNIQAPHDARRIDAGGHMISPGWADLHTHVWYGGTDLAIHPSLCGAQRGVTTIVDAGSAGEANFRGFREFVIEPAPEKILAFLNIGSIGLVAANRVSELTAANFIDIDRTLACVEANRDVIVGIKARASLQVIGDWGMEPIRVAKRVAQILELPLMAHVGAPPPLYDDVLEILEPGDIVTHCFNGRPGGSILDHPSLFDFVQRCADEGIRLDVGHGSSSFSFKVAEVAIERGLMPFTISTDVHRLCLDCPVRDLATTISKMIGVGMPLESAIDAVTIAPRSLLGMPTAGLLETGVKADFTVFEMSESDFDVMDSLNETRTVGNIIEPRWTFLGSQVFQASRYTAT